MIYLVQITYLSRNKGDPSHFTHQFNCDSEDAALAQARIKVKKRQPAKILSERVEVVG